MLTVCTMVKFDLNDFFFHFNFVFCVLVILGQNVGSDLCLLSRARAGVPTRGPADEESQQHCYQNAQRAEPKVGQSVQVLQAVSVTTPR